MENNTQRKIKGYDPNTGQPIYDNSSAGIKKALTAVIICVAVAAAGIIGWLVYDNFFNFTEVDLMDNYVDPSFSGYSGDGILYLEQTYYEDDWVSNGENVAPFYDSIEYTADKTEGLSNGDTVTVTAKYNEAYAKNAKIKVKNASKTYEVTGLIERFKSDGSDIPQDTLAIIKQYMSDYVDREINDSSWEDHRNDGMERLMFISATLGSDDYDYYDDVLIGIFKTSYMFFDERETRYVAVAMGPMDKGLDYGIIDALVDDATVYVDYETFYDESLNEVVKDIETAYNRDTVTTLAQ